MKKYTVIEGTRGVGKTTFAKKYAENNNLIYKKFPDSNTYLGSNVLEKIQSNDFTRKQIINFFSIEAEDFLYDKTGTVYNRNRHKDKYFVFDRISIISSYCLLVSDAKTESWFYKCNRYNIREMKKRGHVILLSRPQENIDFDLEKRDFQPKDNIQHNASHKYIEKASAFCEKENISYEIARLILY